MSVCHMKSCSCTCHQTLYGHPEYCALCECNWDKMYADILSKRLEKIEYTLGDLLKDHKKIHIQNGPFVNDTQKTISDHNERIQHLEESLKLYFDKLAELSLRIEKIRSECRVAFENQNEKPHKCPICDGEGKKEGNRASNYQPIFYMHCLACDGQGIVWR